FGVRWKHRVVFLTLHQVAKPSRKSGCNAARSLDSRRKLGWMGGRKDHHWCCTRRLLPRDLYSNGCVRIEQVVRLRENCTDGCCGLVHVRTSRVEFIPNGRERVVFYSEAARLLQALHVACHRFSIATGGLEQQALKVRGHLNIHRW